MILPGIFASQITGHLANNNFISLQTVNVGSGGVGSITFTSIPTTYTHLQIRGIVQTNRATYGIDEGYLTFNGDSGSNYAYHYMYGDGSSPTAGAYAVPAPNVVTRVLSKAIAVSKAVEFPVGIVTNNNSTSIAGALVAEVPVGVSGIMSISGETAYAFDVPVGVVSVMIIQDAITGPGS